MPNDAELLIRRWFTEVWNNGHDAAIEELAAPNCIIHGLGEGGRPLNGPAEYRQFYNHFRSAFSNIHVAIEDVLSEGERASARFTFTADHTGDSLGIPATGRPVKVSGMVIARSQNGKLIEGWNEFDAAGMMQQLAGPAPVAMRVKA